MGRLSRQREAKQCKTLTKLNKKHPIDDFFRSYESFHFGPSASCAQDFQRLRRSQGWKRNDIRGSTAWDVFRRALVMDFNAIFGTDATDLLAWQTLCAVVGVKSAQQIETWETCEEVLQDYHFNLVDVVDAHRRGPDQAVPTFTSAEALTEYTRSNAAYFPRNHEAAGNLFRRVLKKPNASRDQSLSGILSGDRFRVAGEFRAGKTKDKSALAQRIRRDVEDIESITPAVLHPEMPVRHFPVFQTRCNIADISPPAQPYGRCGSPVLPAIVIGEGRHFSVAEMANPQGLPNLPEAAV